MLDWADWFSDPHLLCFYCGTEKLFWQDDYFVKSPIKVSFLENLGLRWTRYYHLRLEQVHRVAHIRVLPVLLHAQEDPLLHCLTQGVSVDEAEDDGDQLHHEDAANADTVLWENDYCLLNWLIGSIIYQVGENFWWISPDEAAAGETREAEDAAGDTEQEGGDGEGDIRTEGDVVVQPEKHGDGEEEDQQGVDLGEK